MGIFDRVKKSEQKNDSQLELPILCYRLAYFVLPELLFSDAERTIGYFTNNDYPPGPYFYALATRVLEVEGNREDALSFQTHTIELADGVDCYILEYPKPPAVDLTQGSPVLAPFFSVIIRKQGSSEVPYYILGQNPMSGTTFRSLTPDGANANMGPGPEPDLDAFMEFLKQRT